MVLSERGLPSTRPSLARSQALELLGKRHEGLIRHIPWCEAVERDTRYGMVSRTGSQSRKKYSSKTCGGTSARVERTCLAWSLGVWDFNRLKREFLAGWGSCSFDEDHGDNGNCEVEGGGRAVNSFEGETVEILWHRNLQGPTRFFSFPSSLPTLPKSLLAVPPIQKSTGIPSSA